MESKNIKDYLYLYLGCEAKGWRSEDAIDTVKIDANLLEQSKAFYLKVMPILRPLSDMTDREVLDIVSIVLRKQIDYLNVEWNPDRTYVVVHYNTWLPQGDYDKERWEKCELNIAIANDFTIYNHANYIKGNATGVSNEPLYKQHEATRYLLSKGFDLFGLIDEGLAIKKSQ